jgi:6-phosphofructokinase 2
MTRIVTLTLNPAVDVAFEAEAVVAGHKIRVRNETHDPGGGGVNVARVLHEMGEDAVAVVLAGGVTGAHLQELLAAQGVAVRAVPIAGNTRICTTVMELSTGQEFRFVPEGPLVHADELAACSAEVETLDGDWLVISGSLPRGAPETAVRDIAVRAVARGVGVIVDTSGPGLVRALGCGLTLIKPSLRECEALLGRELDTKAAQDAAALELVRRGAAVHVVISLGAEGALLATQAGVVRHPGLVVEARGAVGAGDSMVAAMTRALARGAGPREVLAWGIAGGSAAVVCTGTAHPQRADIERFFGEAMGT